MFCSVFEDKHEKFCDISVLLFFCHWDNVPSIRPPHTMVLWGAIRLDLVGPVHMGVMVNNAKNTAHVAAITENKFKLDGMYYDKITEDQPVGESLRNVHQ